MADCFKVMDDWYREPIGKQVLALEQAGLEHVLSSLHGDFLLHIGGPSNVALTTNSTIKQRVYFGSEGSIGSHKPSIVGDPEALPMIPNSVDVVLLPHSIHKQTKLDQLLDEIYIALRPQGYLLILDFNAVSLWGLVQTVFRSHRWPHQLRCIPNAYLRKKLIASSYQWVNKKTFCLGVPGDRSYWLSFLDKCAKLFGHCGGGIRLVVAQKQVMAPNLHHSRWKKRRKAKPIRGACPEVNARNEVHE